MTGLSSTQPSGDLLDRAIVTNGRSVAKLRLAHIQPPNRPSLLRRGPFWRLRHIAKYLPPPTVSAYSMNGSAAGPRVPREDKPVTLARTACAALIVAVVLAAGCGQNVGSSSAAYNQGGATGGAGQFGRKTGPNDPAGSSGVTGGSTLVMGVKVSMADLTDDDSQFKGDFARFVEWCRQKGFGAIGVYGVEPTSDPEETASFWFDDVDFPDGTTLAGHGFAAGGKNIAELVTVASQSGIGVQVDLTRLALSHENTTLADRPYAGDSLTADQVGLVCSYLLEVAKADSITGRGFPADWVAAANKACQASDRLFFAGDYAAVRTGAFGAAAPVDLGPETVTRSELAMAGARIGGFMLWPGVSVGRDYGGDSPFTSTWRTVDEAEAMLTFRAVASAPQGLFVDMPPALIDKLDKELIGNLKRYIAMRRPRPVCSVLVIGDSTPANLTAVVNGLSAAGYAIVLGSETHASPADADATYILVTRNADGKMPDPAASLPEGLFNQGKTCFLQVCGPLPDLGAAPGWDAIRRSFGIGNLPVPALAEGPSTVSFGGTDVPCAAKSSREWGMSLTEEALEAAETLAVGVVDARLDENNADEASAAHTREVVVLSSYSYGAGGRNILVNGAELAPEMAFPISNLLADGAGLQAPTRALCSVGSPTVALALASEQAVALAYQDGGERKTLERALKSYEVAVLEVAQESAVNEVPLSDRTR